MSSKLQWRAVCLIVALISTTLACGFGGSNSSPSAEVAATGRVRVFSPTAGQTFIAGSELTVQSTSIDSVGLTRVELLVGQEVVRVDANPEPSPNTPFVVSQAWRSQTPGQYDLRVRAYNVNGDVWLSTPVTVQVMPGVTPAATRLATLIPARPAEATPPRQSVARDVIVTATSPPPTPIGVRGSPTRPPTPTTVQGGESAQPTRGRLVTTPPVSPNAAPLGVEVIVDNSAPTFQTSGVWFLGDGGQSYNGSCAWSPRGSTNNAYWIPNLPTDGMYDVSAWWCGDPNHDQATAAQFTIKTAEGEQVVRMNLRRQAGQWNSLGRYFLTADGQPFVNVNGGFEGNVVADAVKFTLVSGERLPAVLPIDQTETVLESNNPPQPYAQLSAGDLSRRLLVTGNPFYEHTPVIGREERQFDDCQTFPRAGCGGTVFGWAVTVRHVAQSHNLQVTYHLSQDYQQVTLVNPPQTLKERQRIFLTARDGLDTYFEVDRYPVNNSWHLFRQRGGLWSDQPLPPQVREALLPLIEQYNTVSLRRPDGSEWVTLYGWGVQTALSPDDAARLETLAQQLLSG